MSNDKMREEFEACAKAEQGLDLTRLPHGGYRSFATHQAWWAWQASRAALVIDIPDENDDRFWSLLDETTADGNSHIFLEGTFTHAVHEAIEAAGVKVKP